MTSSLTPEVSKSTYLEQTEKHVKKTGEREYLTTGDPELSVPHFTKFIEDGAYSEALSGKVIHCVDIVLLDENTERVLIGTRAQEPQAGDWVIGGSMRAGETVEQAAARNLERELHLPVDQTKLSEVGNYKFIWDSRAQPSTVNEAGQEVVSCHTASTLEVYPISEDDVDLSFNDEYSAVKWVDVLDIVDAPEGTYHPCLVDMISDLLEKQTTPEAAKTKQEAINRHLGAIAWIDKHGPMK